ncbi:MAG: hypothetical protein GW875_11275 [Deltaproteobacteria bacterium]|nr:hypothetical protein [Deltaproteobacteria bacterium]NCP03490.1 hypothetical protein [Deltaproteobacteria bacterium]
MIDSAHWSQLENLVEQLLERNLQLEERCALLSVREKSWRTQRDDLLVEIESLLAELEQLRELAQ